MSIFGAEYESDLLEIMEDLDMIENRIKDLRNPRDANYAVSKRYMNKRIEYKTKDLENKLTTIQTEITNILQQLDGTKPFTADLENKLTAIQTQIINTQKQLDGTKPFTSDLDMGNIMKTEHNVKHENDAVTAKFVYDYAKIADKNS